MIILDEFGDWPENDEWLTMEKLKEIEDGNKSKNGLPDILRRTHEIRCPHCGKTFIGDTDVRIIQNMLRINSLKGTEEV